MKCRGIHSLQVLFLIGITIVILLIQRRITQYIQNRVIKNSEANRSLFITLNIHYSNFN